MSINSTTRRASMDEIVSEMDRRGQVIEDLEVCCDTLLDASKVLMGRLERLVGSYEFGTNADIHALRAAIARAEGRSE